MGVSIRSVVSVLSALTAALAIPAGVPTPVAVLVANTTALVMGGTFHPLTGPRDSPEFVTAYLDNAVDNQIAGAYGDTVTNAVAVYTPEEFFPLGKLTFDDSVAEGLANLGRCLRAEAGCVYNVDPAVTARVGTVAPQHDDTFVVFGYSQSAAVASLLKRQLIDAAGPEHLPATFMLTANPMRPNGGVLGRFPALTIPILGITFHGATPTAGVDGAYRTVDVVRQYDGLGGDFPVRPLNLLATVNALLGYGMLHGETVDAPFSQARFQGREGDTDYYLIGTDLLPLLQPLQLFVPRPILSALDAPLRVLIEDAYDRDAGPGVPTPARWWPVKDLAGTAAKLIASVPVAVDNLTEGFGFGRVLGTSAPGVFGVGGPDLPDADGDATAVAALEDLDEDVVAQRDSGSTGDRAAPAEEQGSSGADSGRADEASDPEQSAPDAETPEALDTDTGADIGADGGDTEDAGSEHAGVDGAGAEPDAGGDAAEAA